MNYNKSVSLCRFFTYFLKAYSSVVHMALELSLGSKIYLASASGAVWADSGTPKINVNPTKVRELMEHHVPSDRPRKCTLLSPA